MSRIGNLPINIPDGVKVDLSDGRISVEGPKGKLEENVGADVTIKIDGGTVVVNRNDDSRRTKAYHGLYKRLIENMVTGVSTGFSKTLLINGVGYRVEQNGQNLIFSLGYSDPIEYPLDEELSVTIEGNNKLTISGADKQKVGQTCAEIRSLRPPEPYKGKGVRYEEEYVRRKIGKAGIK